MKVIIFLLMVSASQASIIGLLTHKWEALRVSWYGNPTKWHLPPLNRGPAFDPMPRQLSEIKTWEVRDDLCATGGGKLVGQRYWLKKDPVLNLLFDKNGYIAGVTTSIPKSKFTPPAALKDKNYQDDGDYWTLAAYFIDPKLICGAGRTKEEFEKTGTGSGLYIQTGPNAATDYYFAPAEESDIKKSMWGSGKCFPTMGQHYWFNITKDMPCTNIVPNCILYTHGKLDAFCFAINGDFESDRYDNPKPTNDKIKLFMEPLPSCFYTEPSYKILSTLHVYFSDNPPLTSLCPLWDFGKGVIGGIYDKLTGGSKKQ